MARREDEFSRSVFVNCPFDPEYLSLLRPLLFTVIDLGFIPRIASERSDSGESRIEKISALIAEPTLSAHFGSGSLRRSGSAAFTARRQSGIASRTLRQTFTTRALRTVSLTTI